MLGKAADHFMNAQARERVIASTPNGGGAGYNPPDQERSGTPHVRMRAGMTAPTSQTVVPSGALPGMGRMQIPRGAKPPRRMAMQLAGIQPSGALPGMGHYPLNKHAAGAVAGLQPSGALPGMGTWRQPSGALPGMGDVPSVNDIGDTLITYLPAALVIGFVYYWLTDKKR